VSAYYNCLDSLRGIAILLVILQHMLPPNTWIRQVIPLGAYGSHMFLFQSGLLITLGLLRIKNEISDGNKTNCLGMKEYIVKRLLRILPVYLVFLIIAYTLSYPAQVRSSLVWHLFFMSNVKFGLMGSAINDFGHLWMLSVIVQFYLIWPFIVLIVPLKLLPKAIVVAIVGSLIYKAVSLLFGVNWEWALHQLPSCFDTIGLGALLAYALHTCRDKWLDGLISFKFLLAILLMNTILIIMYAHIDFKLSITFLSIVYGSLNYLVISLLCCWLVAVMLHEKKWQMKKIVELPPLPLIGVLSYGMYLFHPYAAVCGNYLNSLLSMKPSIGAKIVQDIAISITVAGILRIGVEMPFNRLMRKQ